MMSYKEIYKAAVNEMNPSPELVYKIKRNKENRIMKFGKKKMAIVAAVACMAIGVTVGAAGKITSTLSWSGPQNEKTDYSSVSEYLEHENPDVAIPEILSNGYAFASTNNVGVKGVDDNGNTLAEGEKFQVTYEKAGAPELLLFVSPALYDEDYSNATAVKEIGGVAVYYNEDTYKFVPSGYEWTEEDKENAEGAHFYISEGADEVEISTVKSLIFEKEEKSYNLLSFDNDLVQEEWFSMAEEMLK